MILTECILREKGDVFYFIYFFDRHPIFGKKIMIEIDTNGFALFYTQKDGFHSFDLLADYLFERLFT